LKKVDFIPPFVQGAKRREQWVGEIVRWSAKMVFEQIQKGNDTQYFHLFKEFLAYSGIDLNQLKSIPSPFHQKLLERVSNNFGSSWMEHMTPFPQELLLYVKE